MMYEKNNNSAKFTNKNISRTTNSTRETLKQPCNVRTRWVVLVPPVAAILCYLNGLHGDFVHDDVFAIKQNPDVFGGTPITSLFKNDYWGRSMSDRASHKSYRPLTILTFRLNYELTGKDPFYFHLVNCALHLVVTCLFTYTCRHVLQTSERCSVICATLFAVHPIHTEAVTGLVGRADLLAAVLFLLSFISYTKSLSSSKVYPSVVKRPTFFVASLAFAGLAMLCKENGITVLGVCALYDIGVVCKQEISSCLKTRKYSANCKPLAQRVAILFSEIVCLFLFRWWIMNGDLPIFQAMDNPGSFDTSFKTRWLTFSFIWSHNVWLLLAPITLCYDWQTGSIPLITSLYDLRNLSTLVQMFLFTTFVFVSLRNILTTTRRKTDSLSYICLILSVVPFLPASNIFFRVGFVVAERILYIPSLGYCLCIGAGFETLTRRYRGMEKALLVCLTALLALHATKTFTQNNIWRSRESLFRSGVQAIPHNAKAQYNYANYLNDEGLKDEAIQHYREAIRLENGYAQAHNNLGTLLDSDAEAEYHFLTTLQLRPKHLRAHINLGNLYFNLGEQEKGLNYLHKALLIDDTNRDALTSLATCYIETGNYVDSEAILKRVVESHPDYAEAYVSYGGLLSKLGKHAKAAHFYQKAYQVDKSRDSALVHATKEYKKLGDIGSAENLLKQAISLQKEPSAYEQLAILYYNTGRTAESVELFDEMSRLFPNSTENMLKHAKILSNTNAFERATSILRRILSAQPNNVDARWTLALVFSRQQFHKKAIKELDRALEHAEATKNPDLNKMYADRGDNYKDIGDYENALRDYKTVLKSNYNDVMAHTNIGAIYHVYGQYKDAELHYREALRVKPGNELVLENLSKLRNLKSKSNSDNG